MKGIFLLLGSNLGDKEANLRQAIQRLGERQVILTDYSSVYETAPWGNTEQDWFLNMVIRVDTVHAPHELIRVCQKVEEEMGRKRITKWDAREIDIDILYYDNVELQEPGLTLPHLGIAMRRFTLLPLAELVPNEVHPVLRRNQKELLDMCPDASECFRTELLLDL